MILLKISLNGKSFFDLKPKNIHVRGGHLWVSKHKIAIKSIINEPMLQKLLISEIIYIHTILNN